VTVVTDVEPWFVAKTLEWCNEIRVEKGQEPLERLPKGEREDPWSCPCGAATGLYVGNTTCGMSPEDGHPLPGAVVEFVKAFDNRELPQYDENSFFPEEADFGLYDMEEPS
jgi:hypothetical protein